MSLSFAKQIIFEDKHLLIINKLPGQLSQGGNFIGKTESRGNNLIEMGSQYLGKNPYLVHRLDRPASGVLIMTKTKAAAAALSKDLKQRKLQKHYLAVVNGNLTPKDEITYVKSLITSSGGNYNKTVVILNDPTPEEAQTLLNRKNVKEAELSFKVLHNLTIPVRNGTVEQTILDVRLHSGRKHQIRSQLASMGHPIVGDGKYGAVQVFQGRDIALHAVRAEFFHPIDRSQLIRVQACVPAIWRRRFGNLPQLT